MHKQCVWLQQLRASTKSFEHASARLDLYTALTQLVAMHPHYLEALVAASMSKPQAASTEDATDNHYKRIERHLRVQE